MSGLREDDDLKAWKQSKVLSTSIEDDKLRCEIDVAKKRAAAQNVDYPTFAAMVSAAHLQPVDKKAMGAPRGDSGKTVPAWSFSCSGDLLRQSEQSKPASLVSKDEVLQSLASIRKVRLKEDSKQKHPPAAAARWSKPAVESPAAAARWSKLTAESFQKIWSSLAEEPPAKKVEFLAGSSLPNVFRVEMPPGVVMSIVEALLDVVVLERQGSAVLEACVEVLSSMARCSRFQIALKLMELKGWDSVDRLFDELGSSANGNEDLSSRIKQLQALFCRKK